jgi:elongation factor G
LSAHRIREDAKWGSEAYHEVDSSTIVFEIATRSAMWEGVERAGIKPLESIMDVEVVTPGEFAGDRRH